MFKLTCSANLKQFVSGDLLPTGPEHRHTIDCMLTLNYVTMCQMFTVLRNHKMLEIWYYLWQFSYLSKYNVVLKDNSFFFDFIQCLMGNKFFSSIWWNTRQNACHVKPYHLGLTVDSLKYINIEHRRELKKYDSGRHQALLSKYDIIVFEIR